MNAAAAREVGREMERYPYSPPRFPEPEPHPDYNTPHLQLTPKQGADGYPRPPPSPLEPPYRPFVDGTTSSHITGDVAPSADLPSPYDVNARDGEVRRDSYDDAPTPQSPVSYAPSPLSSSANNNNYAPPHLPPLPPHPGSPIVGNSPHGNPVNNNDYAPPYPPPQPPTPGSPLGGNTPYGTPLESPRIFPMTKSTSSLTAPPTGTRTISAAAFRRPQARHTSFGNSDAVPGSPSTGPGRRLPTSPLDGRERNSSIGSFPAPPPNEPQDYIGAYPGNPTAESPGSPRLSDYGALGNVRVTNTSASSPGYGEGRFATDLDQPRQ